MSDEPTPTPTPSLRLKPRLRPDAPATPPPSIPKIAIAQTLDADGVLPTSERKVFTAAAPEPSAPESAADAAAPADDEQPKKISLAPKLSGEAKSKRFSLPAANPTSGLKRLPPPIPSANPPTPGMGEDGAPPDEDGYFSAPAKTATTQVSPDENQTAGDAAIESSDPHASSDSGPTDDEANSAAKSAHKRGDLDDKDLAEPETDAPASSTAEPDALTVPHPDADVPTRFSPPQSETGEGIRFKLKPRLSAPENPPMASGVSLPPPIPSATHAAPPPGIKIVPTAPVGLSSSSLPAKVALQPRKDANGERKVRRVVVKSEKSRILKYFLITFGVIAAIGLTAGGFLAFRYLTEIEKHPASEPVPAAHVPPKKVASTTNAAVSHTAAPAKAPNPENEESDSTAPVGPKNNAPLATKTTPASAAPASATPATTSTSVAATAAVAAPVKHIPEAPKVVEPTPEFRAFIVNLRVSGVFQGAHPRALLNGRLLNAGEMLDPTLQIRFIGLDAAHKQLLFEDGTGAQVQRHY